MNPYEIMLLLDPELADERQSEILSRARELVESHGGAWQSQDVWGRRKLAFEIDHKGEAVYYLLQFDADAATLDELTRVLKITDGVMRHLAVRRIEASATTSKRERPPREAGREAPARDAVPAGE
ncbi:MAG TPA: 30S ribosomal protein S6 [Gaiellaceae bacterium]|nr:30S ribosomal protein S6 [Gaiellaceae bacterium]